MMNKKGFIENWTLAAIFCAIGLIISGIMIKVWAGMGWSHGLFWNIFFVTAVSVGGGLLVTWWMENH